MIVITPKTLESVPTASIGDLVKQKGNDFYLIPFTIPLDKERYIFLPLDSQIRLSDYPELFYLFYNLGLDVVDGTINFPIKTTDIDIYTGRPISNICTHFAAKVL